MGTSWVTSTDCPLTCSKSLTGSNGQDAESCLNAAGALASAGAVGDGLDGLAAGADAEVEAGLDAGVAEVAGGAEVTEGDDEHPDAASNSATSPAENPTLADVMRPF